MTSQIEHILRSFFNHIGFGLLVVDENLHIVHWNEMVSLQSGLSLSHCSGAPIAQIFPGSDITKLRAMAQKAIEHTRPVFSHWRKSPLVMGAPMINPHFNTYRLESLMMFSFDVQSSGEKLLGFVQYDATDIAHSYEKLNAARNQLAIKQLEQGELIMSLRQANRQLVQSEKMAAIGQLAAGVAHEINNPISYVMSNINAMSGYINDLSQLMQAVESGVDVALLQALTRNIDFALIRADIQDLLDESMEGITRVRKIIQSLKDFSHQSGDEFAPADLGKAIRTSLSLLHNEIKYKAKLVEDFAELPPVECILSEINQVLINLLVNAAQAIETPGVITIRTGVAGNKVWIDIEDTGCGMDAATQKRIFDPFFTTKPVGMGTGLGLSLSYNIIQKHGGTIEVLSELGKGTCFHVELPIFQPQNIDKEATDEYAA